MTDLSRFHKKDTRLLASHTEEPALRLVTRATSYSDTHTWSKSTLGSSPDRPLLYPLLWIPLGTPSLKNTLLLASHTLPTNSRTKLKPATPKGTLSKLFSSWRDLILFFRHQLRVKIKCDRKRLDRIKFNWGWVHAVSLVVRKGATVESAFPPLPDHSDYGPSLLGPHPR